MEQTLGRPIHKGRAPDRKSKAHGEKLEKINFSGARSSDKLSGSYVRLILSPFLACLYPQHQLFISEDRPTGGPYVITFPINTAKPPPFST